MSSTIKYNKSENSKQKRISIVISDDYPLIRDALRLYISEQRDMELIAEAGESQEAVGLVIQLKPDILILDGDVQSKRELDFISELKEKSPATNVFVLTSVDNNRYLMDLIRVGVSGYISKNRNGKEITHAIRSIASGKKYFYQLILHDGKSNKEEYFFSKNNELVSYNDEIPLINKPFYFSEKEIRIIRYLAKGMTNKEISVKTNNSLSLIKAQLKVIFQKMEVSSRTELVINCLKNGILSVEDLDS